MTESQGDLVLVQLAAIAGVLVDIVTGLNEIVFLLQVCALGVGFIWGALTMIHWIQARKMRDF